MHHILPEFSSDTTDPAPPLTIDNIVFLSNFIQNALALNYSIQSATNRHIISGNESWHSKQDFCAFYSNTVFEEIRDIIWSDFQLDRLALFIVLLSVLSIWLSTVANTSAIHHIQRIYWNSSKCVVLSSFHFSCVLSQRLFSPRRNGSFFCLSVGFTYSRNPSYLFALYIVCIV